jgi:hypothetical protein
MPKNVSATPRKATDREPFTADLVQVDRALESMRDSGFDLTAAAGEPIDNSIEAGATLVRVTTEYDKARKKIEKLVFADNGSGIDPKVLAHALSVGYSTRYNSRKGLGRFGVGMKLAALSVAERVDIYTRPAGSTDYYHAYFDLELIRKGEQKNIAAVRADGFPSEYEKLMSTKDGEFTSGTLVIWSKVDRLEGGGRYGTALDEKVSELRAFLARAYRKFLDKGVSLELNGKLVYLHDPLFLLENPRLTKAYPEKTPVGSVVDYTDEIDIDGHHVKVTVALVPEELRWREGDGGAVDKDGKDISDFHITKENAGRLSILRNGREIYYDIVPRLYGGIDKVDRYIAMEVSFPADLDEYFQVRNVKRGAEPVTKLREELRGFLQKPISEARKQIRTKWGTVEQETRKTLGDHAPAMTTVEKVDQTSARGLAGVKQSDEERVAKIRDLLAKVNADPAAVEQFKEQMDKLPFVIVDDAWKGKDLFEITHLNGKAIIKFNTSHPFFKDVYDPLRRLASTPENEVIPLNAVELARKVLVRLDMVFLAYAKAENMNRDPDAAYSSLREYWGQFLSAYLTEAAHLA